MDRNSTPTKVTRKRKRAADSLSENSDDDLKKRGRPRTEKPDASAADVSLATACSVAHEANMFIDTISAPTYTNPHGSARVQAEKRKHT